MEVHHPHQPTHKKKWHEYLLEFLMLFLAVFLGFLAENFREQKVERHRVKQHMHTMVENIKYDTTRYGFAFRNNLLICDGLDTFRYQVVEAIQGRVDANKLYYYYWKYGRNTFVAVPNASAMTQLKSSGMLRMVKTDSLVAEMGEYYERRIVALDLAREVLQKTRDRIGDTYRSFFSYVGFDYMLSNNTTRITHFRDSIRQNYFKDILLRDPPLQLISTDKKDFQKLYEEVSSAEFSFRSYISSLRYCLEGGTSLLKHIKETYHFQ